jgi:hypothetical protein
MLQLKNKTNHFGFLVNGIDIVTTGLHSESAIVENFFSQENDFMISIVINPNKGTYPRHKFKKIVFIFNNRFLEKTKIVK